MAEVKISGMTPGAALDGTELLEMVQAAGTFSATSAQIRTWSLKCPVTLTGVVGSSALTLTGATQTTNFPVLSATQTWNAGGVTFTGVKLNITSSASAAGSLLMDLQTGGVSQFAVGKAGSVTALGLLTTAAGRVAAVRVVTAAGAITVTTADWTVVVNKSVGAASAVALPAGVAGQVFNIKDGKGDAAANNITITPAAGNIDGAGTLVMTTNYQSVTLQYNGASWSVL